MTTPPPLFRDQRKIDAEHLRLLVVFHYVGAGLSLLGLGFIALHYALMKTVFANPKMWEGVKGAPPPAEVFTLFKWFYLIGTVFLVVYGIVNLVSATFIKARRGRIFSMVVAGFNCLHMPLGTALGVFTFVVLMRDSVREVYE
jgi:hypothetical protein